jgi:hypothetical protein
LQTMKAPNIAAKFLAIGVFALLAHPADLAGGQFKRFPETVSPDGSYALAWGTRRGAEDRRGELHGSALRRHGIR